MMSHYSENMSSTEVNESLSVLVLTIFVMRIFNPIDAAAAEHHLVFCQRSRLIREQVLDLTQVLRDVKGPALDPRVQLLVVKV